LSGYDNTQPGRLPDLLPHVSVKRIVDWGADAVKILIYYTHHEDAPINDIKHAFIERIGAECETYEIPFFLEFVGYDPKGGDEKGFEYAKAKPEIVKASMEEFSKPQYKVDVLKVEVPINAEYVEGIERVQGAEGLHARRSADAFPRSRGDRRQAVHLSERRREQRGVYGISEAWPRKRARITRRAVRARHLERRHPGLRQAGRQGAGGVAAARRREEHQRGERRHQVGQAVVRQAGP
jgi:hypothetical protein